MQTIVRTLWRALAMNLTQIIRYFWFSSIRRIDLERKREWLLLDRLCENRVPPPDWEPLWYGNCALLWVGMSSMPNEASFILMLDFCYESKGSPNPSCHVKERYNIEPLIAFPYPIATSNNHCTPVVTVIYPQWSCQVRILVMMWSHNLIMTFWQQGPYR